MARVLRVHEHIAADLDIGEARGLVVDVVGAGAATAEDPGVEPGGAHPLAGVGRRREPLEGLRLPLLEALHMLRAAVSVTEEAAEPQPGELVHEPGQPEVRVRRA